MFRARRESEPSSEDEETYPLGVDHLDLKPLVRDALLLELPIAPLCRADCQGLCPTCGADLNRGPCGCAEQSGDARWSVLDALRGSPVEGDRPTDRGSRPGDGPRRLDCSGPLERKSPHMAVPKKKTSKAKSRSRRASAWTLNAPARSLCPQCHNAKLPHVVCPTCGYYKGRQAIDVG